MKMIFRSLFWSAALSALLLVLPGVLEAQQSGNLKTKINPGRTGVFVDGKYIGPAANFAQSRTYAISPGEHEILLTEPRYKDFTAKVTIEAGKLFELKHNMEAVPLPTPPFGLLRVTGGSGQKYAAVFLNGKYMGHKDEFDNPFQGLQLKAGEYKLTVSVTGGSPFEQTITIKENEVTKVQLP